MKIFTCFQLMIELIILNVSQQAIALTILIAIKKKLRLISSK